MRIVVPPFAPAKRAILSLVLVPLPLLVGCEAEPSVMRLHERGDRLAAVGNFERAAETYERIVARRPGDWEAQYELGRAYLELDRPEEARRALEIAHGLRPGNDDVADALARAMAAEGAANELYAFLRSRAETDRSPRHHLDLARYAMELGDVDTAQQAIRTAIAVDDGRGVEPYLFAASFQAQLGDREAALRRLKQAYGIAPEDPRVLARLRDLGEVVGPSYRGLPPGE